MKHKIAIVYDWLDSWGGVERVLLTFKEIFPNADFYSSIFDEKKASWAKTLKPRTTFLQSFPHFIKKSRIRSLPFYPFAFESLDLTTYDLVISVSSSFAKGIVTLPQTKHINICLTPTRFLWLYPGLYDTSGVSYTIAKPYIDYLKKWDQIAASRPDKIISISQTVARRVKQIYNRNSEIIYPPFDIEYWSKIKFEIRNSKFEIINKKFFLIVSRLEPYKKIALIVQMSRQMDKQTFIIVGKGSQFKKLKNQAGDNVRFLTDLSDSQLAYLYSHASALIMTQEEDFGLVALEAQFFGCPVIAYKSGGATETVIEGKTGIFFDKQTVDSLTGAVVQYEHMSNVLKNSAAQSGPKQAKRFDKKEFKKEIIFHVSNFMLHE